MKIEFSSASPIYIQIIGEIKREIVSGERQPGSKVETVRDMAQEMGVNPNTVQRAFAQLEREGLMYTERTTGRFITSDVDLIKKVKEESVVSSIAEFVGLMQKSGFSKDDILRLVQNYLEGDGSNGR
ncbi:MAG TPA: GntR family transcriptional regulator [Ruminiclostridium sp.]|nr:GntR family transcriptional regulator [Ruminiclostridium sp.]